MTGNVSGNLPEGFTSPKRTSFVAPPTVCAEIRLNDDPAYDDRRNLQACRPSDRGSHNIAYGTGIPVKRRTAVPVKHILTKMANWVTSHFIHIISFDMHCTAHSTYRKSIFILCPGKRAALLTSFFETAIMILSKWKGGIFHEIRNARHSRSSGGTHA